MTEPKERSGGLDRIVEDSRPSEVDMTAWLFLGRYVNRVGHAVARECENDGEYLMALQERFTQDLRAAVDRALWLQLGLKLSKEEHNDLV